MQKEANGKMSLLKRLLKGSLIHGSAGAATSALTTGAEVGITGEFNPGTAALNFGAGTLLSLAGAKKHMGKYLPDSKKDGMKLFGKGLHGADGKYVDALTGAALKDIPLKTAILGVANASWKAPGLASEYNDTVRENGARMLEAVKDKASDVTTGMSTVDKLLLGGGAAALLGGGAYLTNKLIKSRQDSDKVLANSIASVATGGQVDTKGHPTGAGGRVRITLPTQREGDAETVVDLPMEQIALSKSILQNIGRDTRRRLRAGGKERTKTRTPQTIEV